MRSACYQYWNRQGDGQVFRPADRWGMPLPLLNCNTNPLTAVVLLRKSSNEPFDIMGPLDYVRDE